MVLDFAKEAIVIPIKKYYNEPDSSISLVFTDKINIDWNELNNKINYDSTGYITS